MKKIFIDGIIFGKQNFGGISKVWEENLIRLDKRDLRIKLLAPVVKRNYSLKNIIRTCRTINYVNDYYYWPSRYFEKTFIRSLILKSIYSVNRF